MASTQGDGDNPRRRGPAIGKHHRGPTNPAEHARRVAWGRKWGAVLSAHAKLYDRKR